MTISEAPLEDLNRFAAERLGWTYRPAIGSTISRDPYWHHPECKDSKGHKDCGASSLDFTTGGGPMVLLERMGLRGARLQARVVWVKGTPEVALWEVHYFVPLGSGMSRLDLIAGDKDMRLAILQAFCLSEGWTG